MNNENVELSIYHPTLQSLLLDCVNFLKFLNF